MRRSRAARWIPEIAGFIAAIYWFSVLRGLDPSTLSQAVWDPEGRSLNEGVARASGPFGCKNGFVFATLDFGNTTLNEEFTCR